MKRGAETDRQKTERERERERERVLEKEEDFQLLLNAGEISAAFTTANIKLKSPESDKCKYASSLLSGPVRGGGGGGGGRFIQS